MKQLAAGVVLAVTMLLLAFYLAPWRGAVIPPGLPPELRDEPNLLLKQAVIEQYQNDGALQYRLKAQQALHFDNDLTRLVEPDMILYNPSQPPWRIIAKQAQFKHRPNAGGLDEDYILLRDDVVLHQEQTDGAGFIRIETSELRVYPEPRRVETERDVMIKTHVGRTVASGLQAKLEQRFLSLQSNEDEPVHTLIKPDLFRR